MRKMLPSGAQGARPEHELQPLLVARSQRTRRASIVNDSLCRLASSSGVAALSDVKSSVTLAVASRGHACTHVCRGSQLLCLEVRGARVNAKIRDPTEYV